MKAVIRAIVDNGEFFEPHEHFAKNIVVGFIRLNGRSVGVIANQPNHLAGTLDINASDKTLNDELLGTKLKASFPALGKNRKRMRRNRILHATIPRPLLLTL